jgi:hypothetical protein
MTVLPWIPLTLQAWLPLIGAFLFGAVVGWMAQQVLHNTARPDVKWLASMIAVLGAGVVTALFEPRSILFGAYCTGLALAFFIREGLLRWQKASRQRTTKGPQE